MSEVDSDSLPNNWIVAPLEDLLIPLDDGRTLHHGWSPQCEKEPSGSDDEWGVLKTTAIQLGAFLPEHNKKLPAKLKPRRQHEVKDGDLLITCAGPRVRCGIPCLVKTTRPRLMLSGKMYRFRVSDTNFDARYLEKYLMSYNAQMAIDAMKTGGNESGLNLTHDRFKPLPVPVAPLNEQLRIASKIDELFSRIEEGERALERVQRLVERYRQSVLKAAVTGELTREWREKHKGKLESGEALLARILKARREAWEKSELGKMKAKGQKSANDNWKRKYKEPVPPNASDLPDLPDGWVWASIDMVADVVGGITVDQKRSKENCETVPYLRVANVQRGYVDLSEIKTIEASRNRIKQLLLKGGDILFNEGGDIDKLGRGWIWEEQLPKCIHQNHVFRARLFIGGDWNKIISWYGNGLGRKLFLELGKQTTNLASLSLSKLKAFPIPLMSAVEASEIVSKVEDCFSITNKEANDLSLQRSLAASLRQAILKAAFSGDLVPHFPTDEPASILLERIAEERNGKSAKKAAPKRRKREMVTA